MKRRSQDLKGELLHLLKLAVNIETSAKMQELLKLMEIRRDEKTIVFTEYRGTQAFIKKHLGIGTGNSDL